MNLSSNPPKKTRLLSSAIVQVEEMVSIHVREFRLELIIDNSTFLGNFLFSYLEG